MRLCVAVFSVLLVLGCAPRLLDDQAAANLVVRKVIVDTSAISGVAGRKMAFDTSPAQINADLTAALSQTLRATPSGNGDVLVQVTSVRLMSRTQEMMLGGASYVQGVITVTDAATGRQIVPPTKAMSTSKRFRLGGPIGAAVAPGASEDYRQTIDSFATSVLVRLSPRRDTLVSPDSPAVKAGRVQLAPQG
ncbi:hypothetical protein GCM10010873_36670 [Cypionkella aquatica]|uniref:Lipoprotein n=1 Tax=Cypionkella aquatica TaxID=1756042 RepID=A0AA37TW29_9RHOB|nr:hypothetical protein [Cypionkella aquatica]GLS88693.1 hypothetical protein GCM10010873_36670 [Cypionkella aquatica]